MTDRATTRHPGHWRPLGGSPGFYVDDSGTIHVDEDEAIRALGYKPTDKSRRALRRAVLDLARQGVTVEIDDE